MKVSDARLMAYVDGELDEAGCAAVEAMAAADPGIAERLERHRQLHDLIAAAHSDVLKEVVPERLLAAARRGQRSTARIIDLAAARRKPERPWAVAQFAGMAACLAVGVIFGLSSNFARNSLVGGAAGGLTAEGPLAHALSDQLAANQGGRPIRIGISFRAADGRYCRTFRTQADGRSGAALAGLACRGPRAWTVPVAMAVPAEPSAAYSMAASPLPAAIARTVDEMIVGEPLGAAGEAKAKASGWRG